MNQADAADLLASARELLLAQLLPALPPRLHYEARMIASAIAMASREVTLGEACRRREAQAMAQLLPMTEQELLEDLEQGRAQLSRAIRQGDFDEPGARQAELLLALGGMTRARVAISNPKVLADV